MISKLMGIGINYAKVILNLPDYRAFLRNEGIRIAASQAMSEG
jgi:hypothetical protein